MQIVKLLVPGYKHPLKCPYPIQGPEGLVYHDTYNSVSAMSEASFSANNNWQVSSHVYVDESRIVQSVLFHLNAWHAGDGLNGKGNRRYECVEVCRSRSNLSTYKAAQDMACKYIAYRLKQLGLPFLPNVTVRTHQSFSGKYCPHRTLSEGLWPEVLGKIKHYYENTNYKETNNIQEERMDIIVYLKDNNKSREYAEVISQRTGMPIVPNPGYDFDKWRGKYNRIICMGGQLGNHTGYATHFCKDWKEADDFTQNPNRYVVSKERVIEEKDKATIIGGAYLQYAGGPEGKAIPSNYVGKTYTVDKIVGNSYRILELWSWIDRKNLR